MASIATPSFLSFLRDQSPASSFDEDYLDNPWYMIAAVAFSGANYPECVPLVFQLAVDDLEARGAGKEAYLKLVRKLKDALFKSGMLTGYSKAINSLAELHKVLKDEWKEEDEPFRDTTVSMEKLNRTGQDLFDVTYGNTASTVQPFLKSILPDLEFFSTTLAYGFTYGFNGVTSRAETSLIMAAALIASDTPLQIGWHLSGARRNGASLERVKAVRKITMDVIKACGLKWKDGEENVPDVDV